MSLRAALVLLAMFAGIVWAILAMAPSEGEMTPLIDQVGQRVEAVAPIG